MNNRGWGSTEFAHAWKQTAEAIKSVADSPISSEPLMLLPREARQKALGDVRDQLRQFELGKGKACDVPAELVVVTGKK